MGNMRMADSEWHDKTARPNEENDKTDETPRLAAAAPEDTVTDTFEARIAARTGNRRGCPVCGERNTFSVQVRINRLNRDGTLATSAGNHSLTRGRSLCEKHALELFDRVEKTLP